MGSKYEHVFEPIRIRGVDFKNRLEMAPPSPNLADREGRVTPEFVDFFRPIAKGGVAIIHVGNSVVDIKEACDEERQLDLGSDACILPLTRFVEMCHGYGALASLEINHNGKDSDFDKTGKAAFSASSFIPSSEIWRAQMHGREPIPTIEMDHAKIKETVEKYAVAAYRCKRAGFKMCMIHGGHGNLISQFASPLYNKRKDDYGGSLENRARFAIEVLDRVRELCGENFVIEYRISADEIHPDGMHFEETLKFIELIQHKVDILHVSAGLHGEFQYMRNWWQNYLMDRMYNVHYAADIKKSFPESPGVYRRFDHEHQAGRGDPGLRSGRFCRHVPPDPCRSRDAAQVCAGQRRRSPSLPPLPVLRPSSDDPRGHQLCRKSIPGQRDRIPGSQGSRRLM